MRLTAPWMAFKLPLRSYIAFLTLASFVSADGTVSIFSLPAFNSQRACAQGCFIDAVGGDKLVAYLSCPNLDACLCRADLTSSASGYISSCVNSQCSSDTIDINSALSIYGSYCANAISPATNAATKSPVNAVTTSPANAATTSPANAATTTLANIVTITSGGSSTTFTLLATVINTLSSAPTVTSTPAPSIDIAAITGIAVGGVLGLAIIGAILFFFIRRKRNVPSPVRPVSGENSQMQYRPHQPYESQQQHTGRHFQVLAIER